MIDAFVSLFTPSVTCEGFVNGIQLKRHLLMIMMMMTTTMLMINYKRLLRKNARSFIVFQGRYECL